MRGAGSALVRLFVLVVGFALVNLPDQSIPLVVEPQQSLPEIDVERLVVGAAHVDPAQNAWLNDLQSRGHRRRSPYSTVELCAPINAHKGIPAILRRRRPKNESYYTLTS